MIRRYCILLIIMLLAVHVVRAQEQTLTESFEQKIYFREAYRYVEPWFRDNKTALNNIKSTIDSVSCCGTLVSVDIQAWASPEGGDKLNRLLAQNRTNELEKWILGNCNVPADKIRKSSGGVGWDILCDMLAGSDLPYRDEVIDIINNTPFFVTDNKGRIITGRKKKLLDHNRGRTWNDMLKRLFPDIRCGLAVVVNIKKEEPVAPDTVEAIRPVVAEVVETPDTVETVAPVDTIVPTVEESRPFYMSVKTNALYDFLLTPNIGVEFYVGNGFTVGANWMYAWWGNDSRHRYWRIYGGDINVRKYFGGKAGEKPLQGHHVGVYAQAYTYDFEFGGKGVMGGASGGTILDKMNYGFGVEYGYSLPVGKRLNIDFSLGLGYFGGEYQEYRPVDGHYVWDVTKNRNYWGPTKAEVSLVWLLGRGNTNMRKGGGR